MTYCRRCSGVILDGQTVNRSEDLSGFVHDQISVPECEELRQVSAVEALGNFARALNDSGSSFNESVQAMKAVMQRANDQQTIAMLRRAIVPVVESSTPMDLPVGFRGPTPSLGIIDEVNMPITIQGVPGIASNILNNGDRMSFTWKATVSDE